MRSIKGTPVLTIVQAAAWIALAVAGTGVSRSQENSTTPDTTQSGGAYQRLPPGLPPGVPRDEDLSPLQQKALHEQFEKRNAARQQQLVADTSKLLKLATELKEEVDKSNKDTLSVAVIRKSEEIEKLARSVKEKMKNPN